VSPTKVALGEPPAVERASAPAPVHEFHRMRTRTSILTNFSFRFCELAIAAEDEPTGEYVRLSTNAVTTDEASVDGFRAPGAAANAGELLKFLIDRTGYIKQLEEEDTPESYSRIENLRELVNAAMDSRDRGETLDEFLDHAALVSDADQYDEQAQITLMTLHAAKGLEFPLVVLAGMEEGLFPHSRTMLEPDAIEEERRLCYVGMTRAMDTLILSRAVYRRRYGTDMPEASVPSRFLEKVPPQLVEELGGSRRRGTRGVPLDSAARELGASPVREVP
jgi:superfamily I DNA/RNA helicase